MLDDRSQSPERESKPQLPSCSNTNAEDDDDCDIDLWEPKPPKVLMDNPNAVPLELRTQIQHYATTE
jgi:hypothetical protein